MSIVERVARRALLRGCSAADQCRAFDVLATRLRRDRDISGDDVLGAAALYAAPRALKRAQITQLLSTPPADRSHLLHTMLCDACRDPNVVYLQQWSALVDNERLAEDVRRLTPRDARTVARDVLYAIHERLLRTGRTLLRERAGGDLRYSIEHASCRCATAVAWATTPAYPHVGDDELYAACLRDGHNELMSDRLRARLLAEIRSEAAMRDGTPNADAEVRSNTP